MEAEAKLLREVQQTFKVLELPTPKTEQALGYVENALEWLDRGLQRPVFQQSPKAPAMPASTAQPVEAALIAEPLPIQPPAEIARWYAASSMREVGNYCKVFERDARQKPDRIEMPVKLWEKLGKPSNWQGIPIARLEEFAHGNRKKVRLVAGPQLSRPARSAPPGAVPVRVGTGL